MLFVVVVPLELAPSVIDLPSVGKASTLPDQVIQVEISKDERITLKSTGTVTKTLQSNMASLSRDVRSLQGETSSGPVVITADRSIKYETVVKAMDTLQRAGVQRVGLSVQLVD